jgi:hypothetical protein
MYMNSLVTLKIIHISRDIRLSVKISHYLGYTASLMKTYFLLYEGGNGSTAKIEGFRVVTLKVWFWAHRVRYFRATDVVIPC